MDPCCNRPAEQNDLPLIFSNTCHETRGFSNSSKSYNRIARFLFRGILSLKLSAELLGI